MNRLDEFWAIVDREFEPRDKASYKATLQSQLDKGMLEDCDVTIAQAGLPQWLLDLPNLPEILKTVRIPLSICLSFEIIYVRQEVKTAILNVSDTS